MAWAGSGRRTAIDCNPRKAPRLAPTPPIYVPTNLNHGDVLAMDDFLRFYKEDSGLTRGNQIGFFK
jgi:hypothetical protein